MAAAAPPDDPEGQWHLDRRVPLAIIVAIILQTFGIAWWASSLSAQVDFAKQERAVQGELIERVRNNQNKTDILLAAVNANLTTLIAEVREINRRLYANGVDSAPQEGRP